MRRLGRWMLNGLTAMSLLLCMETVTGCAAHRLATQPNTLASVTTPSSEGAPPPVADQTPRNDQWTLSFWTTPGENVIVSRELSFIADEYSWALKYATYQHHAFTVSRNYASQPLPGGLPSDGVHLAHVQGVGNGRTVAFEVHLLTPVWRHWFQYDVWLRSISVPRPAGLCALRVAAALLAAF